MSTTTAASKGGTVAFDSANGVVTITKGKAETRFRVGDSVVSYQPCGMTSGSLEVLPASATAAGRGFGATTNRNKRLHDSPHAVQWSRKSLNDDFAAVARAINDYQIG